MAADMSDMAVICQFGAPTPRYHAADVVWHFEDKYRDMTGYVGHIDQYVDLLISADMLIFKTLFFLGLRLKPKTQT